MNVSTQEIRIEAPKGFTPLNMQELWEYRELAFFLLLRDLKARYKQMALGPIWVVLQPLLNMLVFTIIFSVIAKLPSGDVPYPLFNYSALLLWGFFASCLTTASGSLCAYKDLISKVYFPRLLIPAVGVLSALLDYVISFVVLLGMMLYFGFVPSALILTLPLYLLLAGVTGIAVGLCLAPLVAHFWDVQNITGFGVRAWMYACPIVYSMQETVPEKWHYIYRLNPMTNIIEAYRWALLGEGIPPDHMMLYTMLPVFLILYCGALIFRKAERSIVDIA